MLVTRKNVFIKTPPPVVWNQIYRINSWPEWISSVRAMELLESPKAGAKGKLFFTNHKSRIFSILGVSTTRCLQIELRLFWTTMTIDLRLMDVDDGTAVTIEANATGFWEKLVTKFLGRRIGRRFEENLSTLKSLTESCAENSQKKVVNQ